MDLKLDRLPHGGNGFRVKGLGFNPQPHPDPMEGRHLGLRVYVSTLNPQPSTLNPTPTPWREGVLKWLTLCSFIMETIVCNLYTLA